MSAQKATKKAGGGGLNEEVDLTIIVDKSGALGTLEDNLKERQEMNRKLREEAEEAEKRIGDRCERLENHQQRLLKLKEKMEELKLNWREEIRKLISADQAVMKIQGQVLEIPLRTPKTPARPPRRVGGTRRNICFEAESSMDSANIPTSQSSSDVMKTPCQGTPYRSFIETPSSSQCYPSVGRGGGVRGSSAVGGDSEQTASTTNPASYVTRSGRKVKQRTRLIEDL